jgi:hypothetical protein
VLVNKIEPLPSGWTALLDQTLISSDKEANVDLMLWVTKGFVLKGHAQGYSLLGKLIDLLSDPRDQPQTTDPNDLRIIIADLPELFDRKSGAMIKVTIIIFDSLVKPVLDSS